MVFTKRKVSTKLRGSVSTPFHCVARGLREIEQYLNGNSFLHVRVANRMQSKNTFACFEKFIPKSQKCTQNTAEHYLLIQCIIFSIGVNTVENNGNECFHNHSTTNNGDQWHFSKYSVCNHSIRNNGVEWHFSYYKVCNHSTTNNGDEWHF